MSGYEINVSKNGKHYFRTERGAAICMYDAREMFNDLRKRFPKSEGFRVTLSEWREEGEMVEDSEDTFKYDDCIPKYTGPNLA